MLLRIHVTTLAYHFTTLSYYVLFDNLSFVSLMVCIITGRDSRVLFPCQCTIVCFLLFQLNRVQNLMTRLWSPICRQKWFWRIFTNNDIFLSSGGSTILCSLPLLQIILLRLGVLSLLACSFDCALQATLCRHALGIGIFGSVR